MHVTPPIVLRQAATSDIPALWELRTRAVAQACVGHYDADVLALWLAAAPAPAMAEHIARGGGLVAMAHGAILGYAVLDVREGEVDAVFVDPVLHGRGVGRLLLEALEAAARATGHARLFLSASLNAVPFYQRAGFVALREELYPHRSGIGIPSVFMEKHLS